MEVRCRNCRSGISVSSKETVKEIHCPKCGAVMILPPRREKTKVDDDDSHKRYEESVKRVFEPIPKPLAYTVGVVLALMLLSPFWIEYITGRGGNTVYIKEDPELARTQDVKNAQGTLPAVLTTRAATVDLTQFAGVHLDVNREELDHRFNLVLENTRGMQPEIYKAGEVGEIESGTFQFYGGILKEYNLTMRERPVVLDAVLRELSGTYGEPQWQGEGEFNPSNAGLIGAGIGNGSKRRTKTFERMRVVMWSDSATRVEATIFFNVTTALPAITQLQIHVAAAGWLKANQPTFGASIPATPPPPPVSALPTLNGRPLSP